MRRRHRDIRLARRTQLLPPFEPRVDLVFVKHMAAREDSDDLAGLELAQADGTFLDRVVFSRSG